MSDYQNPNSVPWFTYCEQIKTIQIGSSVTSIGNAAFGNCAGLTKIIIPNSVTSIGEGAFALCTNLVEIDIGTGVGSVGYYAFYGCEKLQKVVIHDIAAWCKINFGDYSTGIAGIGTTTNPLYLAKNLYLDNNLLTEITIPDNVTAINDCAFIGCENITKVSLPKNVVSIGNYSFYNCTNLATVYISSGTTSIGRSSYQDCSSLTEISLPNTLSSIGSAAFSGCPYTTIVLYSGTQDEWNNIVGLRDNYELEEMALFLKGRITGTNGDGLEWELTDGGILTVSGHGELTDCPWAKYITHIRSITFENGITSICCLSGYESLTDIHVSGSVKSVGGFTACPNLKNVQIDSGVEHLGTFENCTSLETIVIPDSVASLSNRAFRGCEKLKEVTLSRNLSEIPMYAFDRCESLVEIKIPDGCTSIGEQSFFQCNKLSTIYIPVSVKQIDFGAFDGCKNLSSVIYNGTPDEWSEIILSTGNDELLTALSFEIHKSVALDNGIAWSFTGNTLTISGTGEIDYTTGFRVYSGIIEVVYIEEGITEISTAAFQNCIKLHEIHLPNSLSTIAKENNKQSDAFDGCTSITDVYYSGTEDQWKAVSIVGNTSLTNATFHFVESHSHSLSKVSAKSATCTEAGYEAYWKCADCGKLFSDADGINGISTPIVIKATGHTPALRNIKAATCTEAGYTGDMVCSVCGTTTAWGEEIPAIGHDWGDWVVTTQATETAEGVETRTCKNDTSHKESRAIPKLEPTVTPTPTPEARRYTIVYDAVGGTGTPSSQTKTENVALTLSDLTPTKSFIISYNSNGGSVSPASKNVSCSFTGWNTERDGSGTAYAPGDSYTANADATLYAQWSNPVAGMLPTPTRTGYTFVGWYTASSGGARISDSTTVSENITLYAHWTGAYTLGSSTYSFANYIDSDSPGHCFGMSMTSAAYYNGLLDISRIGGTASTPLYSFGSSQTVKEPICYYQGIQTPTTAVAAIVAGGSTYLTKRSDIASDWEAVVNYVKEHSYDGTGLLQIGFRKDGEGGHAINFLRYENVDGQDRIYAYDNNFPTRETYFYQDASGRVFQAPQQTFSGAIDCIALRDVRIYFANVGDFDASRVVYMEKDAASVIGYSYTYMEGAFSGTEYVLYEIPESVTQITIVPSRDNADFIYLDTEYSFGSLEDATYGVLTFSTMDEHGVSTGASFQIYNDPLPTDADEDGSITAADAAWYLQNGDPDTAAQILRMITGR